ncbi:thiamine-phosphate kinase [Bacillus carboniphilus]|uniref:Thiamine-monophosphate kinase n=1 Tax=Bacillus carboniphilus TaxID=86663 RepID=A0ABY9JWU7_9BACI|nr:thiamine-phosphate kinase [Bacillus carboniphilus]WLR42151.1 thiamine-phosphate kinase [Bacillus carboniphilus]
MVIIRDEFSIINSITPSSLKNKDVLVGIGDDAAVINSPKHLIVCVDTMVEEIHFTKQTMGLEDIGYKSLAINVSDIAAMGGKPLYYLVSISIPNAWSDEEIQSIYKGMEQCASLYQMDLIGGETVSTRGPLTIAVTALGKMESGRFTKRSNAKAGDIIFVTGSLGDSAGGLDILLNDYIKHTDDHSYLIKKHQRPTPKVDLGLQLAKINRVSLNDISDGLSSELYEIAEASSVSMMIEEEAIPMSTSLKNLYGKDQSLQYALTGGEDFELLGTMPSEDFHQLQQLTEQKGWSITQIGEVILQEDKPEVFLVKKNNPILLTKGGYNHFSEER